MPIRGSESADRPVGLVLMHHYNTLDAAGSVAGLLAFMCAIGGLPVVLLRCDISAVGAVAHGAFAGFVGMSSQDLRRCDYSCCRGETLLEVSRLCEVSIAAARARAYSHNIAVHEGIAREVLGSAEPADAWWERCKAGAGAAAALIEFGVSLSVSRWLRQWLERGSPSHDPVLIG
jgi:hypothetical protein